MPYQYIDGITSADMAFEATEDTLEKLFVSCADALLGVMVTDLDAIEPRLERKIHVEADSIEDLLHDFLMKIVFFKDAETLLLRTRSVSIQKRGPGYALEATGRGETVNAAKHDLASDVKAVTRHKFEIKKDAHGWRAVVVLDT